MRQRGRPSSASMVAVMPGDRPKAPDELQPDEAAEWAKIVDRMPPDWFTVETHPVLIQLCRQICNARRIADELNRVKTGPLHEVAHFDRFREWQKMLTQTSASIAILATKLRLTPQSRYDQKVAAMGVHKTEGRPKPWVTIDVDDESNNEHPN